MVPWIDENLNPFTGDWLARTRLRTWEDGRTWDAGKGGKERGKDYNHSTYCDLVINGLIGLRPRADAVVELRPLIPAGTWDYFCLDQVRYHGRWLTVLFDKTGRRYGRATACASWPTAGRSPLPIRCNQLRPRCPYPQRPRCKTPKPPPAG